MSGPSLAKYNPCLDWRHNGNCYPGAIPAPDGEYMRVDDVHALLETLRAIEAARECDADCVSMRADMKCDCSHGRMMATIEEALK